MSEPIPIEPQHLIAVLSEEVNRLTADKMWLTALVRQMSQKDSETPRDTGEGARDE